MRPYFYGEVMAKRPEQRQPSVVVKARPRYRLWCSVLAHRHPKYWLLGIILMFCYLLSYLPHAVLLAIGRALGRLMGALSPKLRHIAKSNITVCFPHLSKTEKQAFVRASFAELGMSVVESLKSWFDDPTVKLWPSLTVEGEENFQAALDSGKGIMLVSCHQGSLDLNVILMGKLVRGRRTFAFTYRQPRDPVVDSFIRDARAPYADAGLSVRNLVGMSRVLRKGGVVWYAPDIEVKNKNTAFVDFMGVSASTTQAVSRIASSANAVVLPYGHYRNADNKSYRLTIFPPLSSVPSEDPIADTAAVNRAIERIIEPFPERYWWAIKRFKHRPEGEKKVY